MSNIESQLRINAIVAESIVDGPGIRYALFVQGCPHHCEGCHNPETHPFEGGRIADEEEIVREILDNPLLSGVTFSGGEPFCQPEALARIAARVHEAKLDVYVYTGFTLEALCGMARTDSGVRALLLQTDMLVDGPFVLEERDLTLLFRGSRNQRMMDHDVIVEMLNDTTD